MGNYLSRFQSTQSTSTSEDHPEKCEVASGLPPCPAFPIKERTESFWMFPPPDIASHTSSDKLPTHADVVIIGSGISGASFARTLLQIDKERNGEDKPLNVIMLEAHDACSGATGRNGGHINPPLYDDYEDLKKSLGDVEAAKQIMYFRLAHLAVLQAIANEKAPEADCRKVEGVDVFFHEKTFEEAKRKLNAFRKDMSEEAKEFIDWEGKTAQERFSLSELVVGCISRPAGAMNAYNFATTILSQLLNEYANFQLFTNTMCTSITRSSSQNAPYTLYTCRGKLTASHVVHLTNAWVSSLVPGLENVVYRMRETMSAQRPGECLKFEAPMDGDVQKKQPQERSYVFYDNPKRKDFDYLVQLRGQETEHELMFGGGREPLPQTDDESEQECSLPGLRKGIYDVHSAAHVSVALPIYFGAENWGAEAHPNKEGGKEWPTGRVKALWSGVLSVSIDGRPWVGRIPDAISGRKSPTKEVDVSEKDEKARTARSGEWIAAGYSGEGMVFAWLCARALALMVLGLDKDTTVEAGGDYGEGQCADQWLPPSFRIDEGRWMEARKKAKESKSRGEFQTVMRGGTGRTKMYEGV